MSREIIKDDSQEVFTIEERTATFTDSGNTIQSVTVTIGGSTYCFSKHSNRDHETLAVHRIGDTPITVFEAKVSKKMTKLPCGTSWTVIKEVTP
tara:strand:- start:532 stop:813 length:282 start_codon:yes stop_codon:yes gene_type:complete